MKTDFWSAGHRPTLFATFLYFDLSFMVWVLLRPLAVQISADLQLTAAQKGMMVATPILSGAILRMLMGILVDHLQPKKAGMIGQVVVLVALPLASRWYPPEHQGTALGIAGAGNSGTALAALFAPASPCCSAGTMSSAWR